MKRPPFHPLISILILYTVFTSAIGTSLLIDKAVAPAVARTVSTINNQP